MCIEEGADVDIAKQLEIFGLEETKRLASVTLVSKRQRDRIARRIHTTHDIMSSLPEGEDCHSFTAAFARHASRIAGLRRITQYGAARADVSRFLSAPAPWLRPTPPRRRRVRRRAFRD